MYIAIYHCAFSCCKPINCVYIDCIPLNLIELYSTNGDIVVIGHNQPCIIYISAIFVIFALPFT